MNLAIGNLIDATGQDASQLLRVAGVDRDGRGKVTQVAVIDALADVMPDVLDAERVSELMDRGDWVLRGSEQETEFDLKQRHIRCLEDIPEKRRARFEQAMTANQAIIKTLLALGWNVFNPAERNATLADLCAERQDRTSPSSAWITALLRRYWRSGNNPYALGPQNHRAGVKSRQERKHTSRRPGRDPRVTVSYPDGTRTDRGGCSIPTQALGIIEKAVADYFEDPANQALIRISTKRWKGLPWGDITKNVNRRLGGLPAFRDLKATRRQVVYLGKPKIDMVAVLRRAKGSRDVAMNHRQLNGDYRDVACFAGQRYEADTFLVDLHLVDDMTGLPIGRLRVYLIVDVFSGMVVGAYGTVNEVDNAHVGRALHSAFAPKVDYCKMFGLDIRPEDWPCEGLPELISADNKELITKAAKNLPELVDVGIARPYRGDDKGTVEVASNLLQCGHVYLYGEGVTQGPKQRCTVDPATQATASVSTFMRGLLRHIVYTHNHRALPRTREIPAAFLKTKKLISPINLWNWSRRHFGGALRRYNPATMMPRLLPTIEASVDRRGIAVSGLYFELPKELDHLRAASTCASVEKVRVGCDPLSTNQVYLIPRDLSAEPIRCPLTHLSREKLNLSWAEKELRDDYVETLHRLTEDDETNRGDATFAEQRADLEKDRLRLQTVYGSKRERNAVAKQVSTDAVKDRQAADDDKRMDAFVHGAFSTPVQVNVTPTTPTDKSPPPPSSAGYDEPSEPSFHNS